LFESHLILNPAAGGAQRAQRVRDAAASVEGVTVRETTMPDDVARFTRDAIAAGVDRLLIAGGDGTLHKAVNTLMQIDESDRPTLGVIPCGSANDFSRCLRISPDVEAALSNAVHAAPTRVDVIRLRDAEGHRVHAINAVTGGLAITIRESLDEQTKRWWGRFAYSVAAVKAAGRTDQHHVKVTTDERTIEMDALGVVVTNGACAGGHEIMPVSDPTDGRIEVAVMAAMEGAEHLKLLGAFAVGAHLESEFVQWCCARHVELSAAPDMPLIVDGEVADFAYRSFDVAPGALRVAAGGDERT